MAIILSGYFLAGAYCQQPDPKGYIILGQTVDTHPVTKIRPGSSFRLDDFLRHSKTVPVTPLKPEVKYRYDEGKGPVYVIGRPEQILFEHKRYGLFYVQNMEELPGEIVFSREVEDGKEVRQIAAEGQRFEIRNFNPLFGEEALNNAALSIDYRESEFYYLYDEMDKLLIVSHPMTWTGLMTSFSFYQLINIERGDDFGSVHEFISFGDSPYLFFRESDYGYFERMEIMGDYDPEKGLWDLSIRGGRENTFRELSLTDHEAQEVVISGYAGDAPSPAKIIVVEVEAGEHLDLAVECSALRMAENFLTGPPYNQSDDPRRGYRVLYTTDTDYYWGYARFGERIPEFMVDTLFRTERVVYDRVIAGINGLRRWMANKLIDTWFDENPQIEDIDGLAIPGFSVIFRVVENGGGYDVTATGELRYYFVYRDLDDEPDVERTHIEAAFDFEATIKDGREISEMKIQKIEIDE